MKKKSCNAIKRTQKYVMKLSSEPEKPHHLMSSVTRNGKQKLKPQCKIYYNLREKMCLHQRPAFFILWYRKLYIELLASTSSMNVYVTFNIV